VVWDGNSGSDAKGDLRGRLFCACAVGAGSPAMAAFQPTRVLQMYPIPVGAGLLAMAVCQARACRALARHRTTGAKPLVTWGFSK
jgi:hypothetical protein